MTNINLNGNLMRKIINPEKIRKGNRVKIIFFSEKGETAKVLSVKNGVARLSNSIMSFKTWNVKMLCRTKKLK